MKRVLGVGLVILLTASFASAGVYTFNPVFDVGDSDGGSDQWSYICQRASYQAWFGFDISAIPDGEVIVGASFEGLIKVGGVADRTCWYDSDDAWITAMTNPGDKDLSELLATLTPEVNGWYTFNLDLSGHDWQDDLGDDYVSLMVTGPANYEHYCATIDLTESGNLPVLEIVTGGAVIPAPGALVLAGIGASLAGWLRRRRAP